MEKLGTDYGGWIVPKQADLNKNSIIYSGGVGEDISFDLLLQHKYNCNIYLMDPTTRAIQHYKECEEYYNNGKLFTGDIQKDYYQCIQNLKPNFDKISYLNIGLWDKEDTLKFYQQDNPNYVSQSFMPNMFGRNYEEALVNNIKNIMNKFGHHKIDLLKLDIEGAENVVLEQMLNDGVCPKYLCIEFDLYLKGKDLNNSTKNIINRLTKIGYKTLVNDKFNMTFSYA